MTDLDYHKIYCECFNKCLTYEKYLPVKDYLYRIIGSFKDAMSYDLDFTKDLLKVFDLIMKENKYDNLDSYIDFLINLHTPAYAVDTFLKVLLFPNQVYEDKDVYYTLFKEICHLVNIRFDNDKFKNSRIDEIIKVYHKYHSNIRYHSVYSREAGMMIYYEKYVPVILGYFYLTNKPIDYLDIILKKFISNYDEIYINGVLSGICDLDHFISSLSEDDEYKYFQLFIDNGICINEKSIK